MQGAWPGGGGCWQLLTIWPVLHTEELGVPECSGKPPEHLGQGIEAVSVESPAPGPVLGAKVWLGELQEEQCLQVGETLWSLTLESGIQGRVWDWRRSLWTFIFALYLISQSVSLRCRDRAAQGRGLRNLGIFGECSEAKVTMKRSALECTGTALGRSRQEDCLLEVT